MLTGDLSLTSGTAVIAGFDIVTDLRKVSSYLNVVSKQRMHCDLIM